LKLTDIARLANVSVTTASYVLNGKAAQRRISAATVERVMAVAEQQGFQLDQQAAGLRREFFLSDVPVEDSIVVWVEVDGSRIDFVPDIDFTYVRMRNSVLFQAYVPDSLAEIYVEYEVLAEEVDPVDISDDTGQP